MTYIILILIAIGVAALVREMDNKDAAFWNTGTRLKPVGTIVHMNGVKYRIASHLPSGDGVHLEKIQ